MTAEPAEPPVVIGSEPRVQWLWIAYAVPIVLASLVGSVFVGPQLLFIAAGHTVLAGLATPHHRRLARTGLVVSDEGLAVTGPRARAVPWHEIRQVRFSYRKRPGEYRLAGVLPTVHLDTTTGWGSGHLVTLGILSRVGEAAASATLERAAERHGVPFVTR